MFAGVSCYLDDSIIIDGNVGLLGASDKTWKFKMLERLRESI
jgi:hypothetical protein